jgi:excisionase family DNA binding protein
VTADNANPTKRRLLKVKQAAAYLSISPWSLRKLVQDQRLRIVQMDAQGPWLIDIADLDQFIEANKKYA